LVFFIIGVGNVVGALLRNLTAGVMTGGDGNALLPRLVHVGVVAIAVITGLQQMGIDISFVTQLALIVLAALLGALSLAFALGARQHVANLMAQSELSRYATGDRLRIDGDEGIIVEIYRTGLTLTTDEGIVSIPASRLANGRVVQVSQKPEGSRPMGAVNPLKLAYAREQPSGLAHYLATQGQEAVSDALEGLPPETAVAVVARLPQGHLLRTWRGK